MLYCNFFLLGLGWSAGGCEAGADKKFQPAQDSNVHAL